MLASTSAVQQIIGAVALTLRVAGHHADAGRPEDVAQGEELLRHQRLDRRGVEAAHALRQGGEVRARGDQALAGSGRGAHDHIGAGDDLDQRLLLVRVQGEALLLRPAGEGVEDRVGIGCAGSWSMSVMVLPSCPLWAGCPPPGVDSGARYS